MSYKILIITGISNETTNELTIYAVVTITIEASQSTSLFQVQDIGIQNETFRVAVSLQMTVM